MKQPSQTEKDYLEFTGVANENPPGYLFAQINSKIHLLENPKESVVAPKAVGIHLLSALVTLSFCPQFGFNPFLDGHGLAHYFMQWGDVVCLFFCGSIFFGMSALSNRIFLTAPEWRRFKEHQFGYLSTLMTGSLFFFWMMAPDFKLHLSVSWIAGGLLTALAISQARAWRTSN